jgi:glycosyltransferase involved in cell wall biosynthesis
MDSSRPTVSVIIPCWNNELHIAAAIDSARSQTFEPLEIIVVDDGSTDGSPAIVDSYGSPVARIVVEHGGQGRARNHGARLARGDHLAFLDADDLWTPRKLELQLAAMTEPPGAAVAFGRVRQFFSDELGRDDAPRPMPAAEAAGVLTSALICRKDTFFGLGGFSEDRTIGETLMWHSRLRDSGTRVVRVDEVVVHRRIHGSNAGIEGRRSGNTQWPSAIKQMLDRRRAEGLEPDPFPR